MRASLLLGLVLLPALALAEPVPAGKPQAPVRVTAQLSARAADLEIAFDAAASEVEVELGGTDGLQVEGSPRPVSGAAFQPGQVARLRVPFVPGPGQSNLVVTVRGRFGKVLRASVASFTVGEKSPAQRERDEAGLQVDSRGETVRVMPAETSPGPATGR